MTPRRLLREATTLNDNTVKLDNKLNMAKLKGFRRRLMIVQPRISEENNDLSMLASSIKPSVSDMSDYDASRSLVLSRYYNCTQTSSDEWTNGSSPTNSILGALKSSSEDVRERLLLEEDKWLDIENREREKVDNTEILTETAKQLRQTMRQLEQERAALEDSISRDTQLLEEAVNLTDILNNKLAQVESTLHPSKQDIENAKLRNNTDIPPSHDLFTLIEIIMSNKEGTVIDLRKHNYWPPHVQLLVRTGMLIQHPRDAFKVQVARWNDKTL
ncbi:hypothetical protein BDF22DRAFT_703860 [Syncephalis plumigaleata]|nr:hypothetical protein BDF22DRAFT_703860 [Syncephalis plumigaleata]